MTRHAVKMNLHHEALNMHAFFSRTFSLLEWRAYSAKYNGDVVERKEQMTLTFSVKYHLL